MNSCKLGFHQWVYTHEKKRRACRQCQKKQEKNSAGKWADSRAAEIPKDDTQYCACPGDYTIALKTMSCPRCRLPRRPRALPTGKGYTPR